MVYKRSDRVGDMIRQVIGEMLRRDLSDPRLSLVTLTEVKVTNDLKLATVFFSAMGDPVQEEASLHGLESAAGYIRKRLGRELRLKFVPDLSFKVDHSFDYGKRIDRLIESIQEEEKGNPSPDR